MFHDSCFKSRGQIIFPLVLVIAVLVGIVGVTLAGAGYTQSLLAGQRTFAEQARQAAQAGMNDALLRIARDKNWGTDTDLNNPDASPGTYNLTVGSVSATISVDRFVLALRNQRTIVSSSTVRNVQRKIFVLVEVSGSGGVQVLSREELTN